MKTVREARLSIKKREGKHDAGSEEWIGITKEVKIRWGT